MYHFCIHVHVRLFPSLALSLIMECVSLDSMLQSGTSATLQPSWRGEHQGGVHVHMYIALRIVHNVHTLLWWWLHTCELVEVWLAHLYTTHCPKDKLFIFFLAPSQEVSVCTVLCMFANFISLGVPELALGDQDTISKALGLLSKINLNIPSELLYVSNLPCTIYTCTHVHMYMYQWRKKMFWHRGVGGGGGCGWLVGTGVGRWREGVKLLKHNILHSLATTPTSILLVMC